MLLYVLHFFKPVSSVAFEDANYLTPTYMKLSFTQKTCGKANIYSLSVILYW